MFYSTGVALSSLKSTTSHSRQSTDGKLTSKQTDCRILGVIPNFVLLLLPKMASKTFPDPEIEPETPCPAVALATTRSRSNAPWDCRPTRPERVQTFRGICYYMTLQPPN
ncbi:hypothetical protein SFRURICE_014542 [Spodoptera frugiperda]|uniref:SFRICE_037976 n=1 Tax=Spodoptera frugiperda TaxID=7108 RepID=A0A2H1X3V4_SPOFR|nr:hypothetical protein SFRURICE_014542 [Spodoptera frugiperda]